MYIKILDPHDNSFFKIATYKKIDNKKYTLEEITIKDDIDMTFIEDKEFIGEWKSDDYIYRNMINGYYVLEKISH